MLKKFLSIYLLLIYLPFYAAAQETSASNAIIQQSKKGVVNVSNKLITSLYSDDTDKEIFGTGFIVDKAQGLVVTNAHLASKKRVGEIQITFFNGRESEAKLLYVDPLVDFAVLKISPKEIPELAVELKLSDAEASNEDQVTIIGNNAGKNYSIQIGTITNLYDSWGTFPAQNIIISLNTKGGSSGSPILNKKGEVIALNYASDQTYAAAIPIAYIKDALKSLNQGKIPKRQDCEARIQYYSLDKAAIFTNFPKGIIEQYITKYPQSFNKALQVSAILENSPAYGILKPGDIIWKIEGVEIGPNLYKYQKLLNTSSKKSAFFEVYRNGNLIKLNVPLIDLYRKDTQKAVMFGGAIFVEADHYLQLITGPVNNKVFITNVNLGSSFDELPWTNVSDYGLTYLVNVISIDNCPINNLNDLVQIIPQLIKKKNFKINYKNFGIWQGFNNIPYLNRAEIQAEIKYNSPGSEPIIMEYNNNKLDWQYKKIT